MGTSESDTGVTAGPASDHTVRWESVKFDGTPHRSATAVDLGTTDAGRWLFVAAGTPVSRPNGLGYDHPRDAVVLIPTDGLWTAMWLDDWDPPLYVDVARPVHVGRRRIVTMDLDVDVVRRPNGDVEVLDLDEFDDHSRRFGYPADLVSAVHNTTEDLVIAIGRRHPPFHNVPDVHSPGTPLPGRG